MGAWGLLQGVKAKSKANCGFSGLAVYVVDFVVVNGDFWGGKLGLIRGIFRNFFVAGDPHARAGEGRREVECVIICNRYNIGMCKTGRRARRERLAFPFLFWRLGGGK